MDHVICGSYFLSLLLSCSRVINFFKWKHCHILLKWWAFHPFELKRCHLMTFADIWGWLEVRKSAILHYTVNQHPHWAFRQYGYSKGIQGWLGIEKCQICLQDTSRSTKGHQRAAVGHWVSLCMKCCRMVDSVPRWQLSPTNWWI